MIKIAIADNQSLFRNMLSYILKQEPDFDIVGEAGDGNEIIHLCEITKPDLVLLDIKMPNTNGISALIKIKKLFPTIKVIMLTTFEDEEYIYSACSHCADGYIIKDTKPDILVHIIKCVHGDLFVIHSSAKQYMLKQMERAEELYRKEPVNVDTEFNATDILIIRFISDGKSNGEIAAQIGYSEGTIKNRISKMLAITQTKDRTQLAIFALQNGIV